jgi:hypothetical protein
VYGLASTELKAFKPPEERRVPSAPRVLLTAGLAAIVVTSIALSMADAGAEQIPAAPSAEGQAPPPLPTWAGEPAQFKLGKAGTSSAALARADADAAPVSDVGVPTEVFAPKGHVTTAGGLDTTDGVNFFYSKATQIAATDGTYGDITVAKPVLNAEDGHTLVEISVQSTEGDIVEVGWNVDRSVNPDADPHLFVYHWVKNVPTCYNTCDWTPYDKTVQPGMTLPTGATKRFGIQHANGSWWIWYDKAWIGSFSDKLWGGTFTKVAAQQYFGEVATYETEPCSEMGNGLFASNLKAARAEGLTLINAGTTTANFTVRATSKYYTTVAEGPDVFRFGGPAGC